MPEYIQNDVKANHVDNWAFGSSNLEDWRSTQVKNVKDIRYHNHLSRQCIIYYHYYLLVFLRAALLSFTKDKHPSNQLNVLFCKRKGKRPRTTNTRCIILKNCKLCGKTLNSSRALCEPDSKNSGGSSKLWLDWFDILVYSLSMLPVSTPTDFCLSSRFSSITVLETIPHGPSQACLTLIRSLIFLRLLKFGQVGYEMSFSFRQSFSVFVRVLKMTLP